MKNYNIPSLIRAISVIESVIEKDNGLTALELERRLGIPKTTIFRILHTLQQVDWLEKKGDRYIAGHRLFQTGMQTLSRIELRSIAMPFLSVLSRETEESAHLGIWAGRKVMVAEVCDGPKHIRIACRAGTLTLPHCSSLGKVLLAYLVGSENMDTFFQHEIPEKKTPNTIVNLKDLKKDIEEIKQQGYAVDNMEYYEDVRCLAAPVKNALGHVVAAVGITATTLTFREDMIHDVAAKVIRIAGEISKALGAL